MFTILFYYTNSLLIFFFFFFFNDTATTEIYTLSLHDALPIWMSPPMTSKTRSTPPMSSSVSSSRSANSRSEEHTSELQSRVDLVCRLLLEKKKIILKIYKTRKKK